MARIPYLQDQDLPPLAETIRARRGCLLNLDRILLHSTPFAEGWNALAGAMRNKTSLPSFFRELAMVAVAVLNGAAYEYHHHHTEFLKAGGTQPQLDALRSLGETGTFDPSHWNHEACAVLQLTLEMTRSIQVSDATFKAIQAILPDQQVVELVGTIAMYNMVSRFLVALHIEIEP